MVRGRGGGVFWGRLIIPELVQLDKVCSRDAVKRSRSERSVKSWNSSGSSSIAMITHGLSLPHGRCMAAVMQMITGCHLLHVHLYTHQRISMALDRN